MAFRTSIQSGLDRWHLRCLRGVLATLIALAVVLTLFNCGCCNCVDGDDISTASVAQPVCGAAGKSGPLSAAPHCCHCLAHATTVASQVDAVAIRYIANPYHLAPAPVPD